MLRPRQHFCEGQHPSECWAEFDASNEETPVSRYKLGGSLSNDQAEGNISSLSSHFSVCCLFYQLLVTVTVTDDSLVFEILSACLRSRNQSISAEIAASLASASNFSQGKLLTAAAGAGLNASNSRKTNGRREIPEGASFQKLRVVNIYSRRSSGTRPSSVKRAAAETRTQTAGWDGWRFAFMLGRQPVQWSHTDGRTGQIPASKCK